MPRLPNFFVVGAPKAGTTSLCRYLEQHPRVYLSPIKEPHFFSDETRVENLDPHARNAVGRNTRDLREYLSGPMRERRIGGIVADWDDYLRLFANASHESALGEASVCYLWSRTAAQRIAEKIPEARIIVMLRNPADRAFSQYLQGLGNGSIRWSFREHIQRSLDNRDPRLSIYHPFLEFGFYFGQLKRYQERFGSSVWVGFHEDLRTEPPKVLRSILRFLGVDAEFTPDFQRRDHEAQVPRLGLAGRLKGSGLWRAAADLTPEGLRPLIRRALVQKPGTLRMEPDDREFLGEFYAEDIQKTSTLLGRDLTSWLRR